MPAAQPEPQGTEGLHAAHGVAGVIIGALVVIVALHVLGFRFVGSASFGVGR